MEQKVGEWLFKEDNYVPPKDKDRFIDKSILSLVGILSKFGRSEGFKHGAMYSLNHLNKFIFTILSIIFLSLSKNIVYVLAVDTYLLLALSTVDIRDMKRILATGSVFIIFSAIMLLPSFMSGNRSNTLILLLKIWGSILSINIFSYTTKWRQITRCLRLFFIPDIFILILDITIKYIFVLGEFSISLLYALKLKSVGLNSKKGMSISGVIGALFLKSREMSEEMYFGMVCRGFTGEYTSYSNFRFVSLDILYSSMGIGFIFLYFLIGR